MKDPDQQIPPSMTADLFSTLQADGASPRPQEQDPAIPVAQHSESASENIQAAAATSADGLQSSSDPGKTDMSSEDRRDMPLPDHEGSRDAEDEAPLYYAPGEPLSGKPGEYFRRQKLQAAAGSSDTQATEDRSPLSGADAAADLDAPAQAPLPDTPHFDHIKVSGPDADRFLDELSKIPPKNEAIQSVGTASSALFKNVVRRNAPAGLATDAQDRTALPEPTVPSVPQDPAAHFQDMRTSAESPDTPPRKTHRGHGIHNSFKILLFLRQIVASFFTHTALGVIFPRVAAKLGPCFPSSMPLPYFLTGFVTALPVLAIKSLIDVPDVLCCALAALVFIVFNGISGFRGITKLCAVFSSSRSDFALATTVTATYLMVLLALLMSLTYLMEPTLHFALILGATLSLSALAGCSLQFSLEADPVDSYGSMSLKGLLFSLVVVLAAVYAVLPPLVATSMVGMALLCNLLFGLYMNVRGLLISRSAVGAVQLITQLMLMLYLTLASGRMLI